MRWLRGDGAVVAAALVVLVSLSWVYVWRGAGMGMSAWDMTLFTLFPHTQPEPMPGMTPPAYVWWPVLIMWWVMMIAMMTPGAAPLVLLYNRVLQHSTGQTSSIRFASPLLLMVGYLLVWLGFSLLAAAVQYALQRATLISPMMLWSSSAWLSAGVLVAAGVYQLSPLKQACLKHCRGPVDFLTRHRRPGRWGALVMGMQHGMWCVGCCWVLMLLLFVGGVMNLVWIALLALLVLAEKLLPGSVITSRLSGALLIIWGLITLAV
ncbi:MAG: DUF2182 domain-containing protein [Steroidobacteraceae bacterium]